MILSGDSLNCILFHNGNFSLRKEFAPTGSEFFPLRAVVFEMENHFHHIRLPPLNVTIFITHVHNLRNGRYANYISNKSPVCIIKQICAYKFEYNVIMILCKVTIGHPMKDTNCT